MSPMPNLTFFKALTHSRFCICSKCACVRLLAWVPKGSVARLAIANNLWDVSRHSVALTPRAI